MSDYVDRRRGSSSTLHALETSCDAIPNTRERSEPRIEFNLPSQLEAVQADFANRLIALAFRPKSALLLRSSACGLTMTSRSRGFVGISTDNGEGWPSSARRRASR